MTTRWHHYIDAVMIARWRYYFNAVMITRWQYCLNAAVITRWHYCTSGGYGDTMKHISPTLRYITLYLRLMIFTKTLPQMSFYLCFSIFLFRAGAPPMTLPTVGALTYPQLPATASNVCTTDASSEASAG